MLSAVTAASDPAQQHSCGERLHHGCALPTDVEREAPSGFLTPSKEVRKLEEGALKFSCTTSFLGN